MIVETIINYHDRLNGALNKRDPSHSNVTGQEMQFVSMGEVLNHRNELGVELQFLILNSIIA